MNCNLPKDTVSQRLDTTQVKALTRGMKRLDGESYNKFFDLYYDRLRRYTITISNGDVEETKEALQVSFEKIVKHIRVFDCEESFWGWLTTVVRNSYFDSYRKQDRKRRFLNLFKIQSAQIDSMSELATDLDKSQLQTALLDLSATERGLVTDKYFQGESYRELAIKYDMTEKAVENKLWRIRKQLRATLEADE